MVHLLHCLYGVDAPRIVESDVANLKNGSPTAHHREQNMEHAWTANDNAEWTSLVMMTSQPHA